MIKFWTKINKKARFVRNYDFSHLYNTFHLFYFRGVLKTHLKMCFNRDIDVTKSHQKSSWVSVKNTQRPLKWNNHDLVCYSPKRNFPKTQLKMSSRRYKLKKIHIISSQNLPTNHAEGSLKTKIYPFWKNVLRGFCFEPLFKIRKIQKVYQCNFALNHLLKNLKII